MSQRIAAARMTGQGLWPHDRGMDLPAPLAWLVDVADAGLVTASNVTA
jgi:hypothetical protein